MRATLRCCLVKRSGQTNGAVRWKASTRPVNQNSLFATRCANNYFKIIFTFPTLDKILKDNNKNEDKIIDSLVVSLK